MKKIAAILLTLTIGIGSMGVFSLGAFAENSLQMRDEMVEIDDFSLHVQMWDYDGDWDEEDDIVFFEAGYGDDADSWNYAMDLVKEVAVQEDVIAIAYDRAGLGESDDTTDQKIGQNQVEYVKTMLDHLGFEGDLTIVAHSIGGMNARLLADEMGPRYAGAVLIDSSHESQNEIMESYLTNPEYADMLCETLGLYDDPTLGSIFQADPTFIVNL
jgi:pimeloyl-ACP methyl ester carboxylesterase